jgi:hypothetical protein
MDKGPYPVMPDLLGAPKIHYSRYPQAITDLLKIRLTDFLETVAPKYAAITSSPTVCRDVAAQIAEIDGTGER